MKKIFQFSVVQVSLILLVFSPAIAQTASQTDASAANIGSASWWLGHAVKQAEAISDPDSKDEIYGCLGRAQALAGDVDGVNTSASNISP